MSIAATSKKLATNTLAGLGAGTTATVSLTYPIAKGLYGLVTIGGKETLQNQLNKFSNYFPVSEGTARTVDSAWQYVTKNPGSTAVGMSIGSVALLYAGMTAGALGIPLALVAGYNALNPAE